MIHPIRTKPMLAVLLAAAAGDASAAATDNSHVEEVVVTASRIPVPLSQIATSVSVITEADIAAHGNLSLTDVLRQLPAISTSSNGGAGKTTTLRIRGEDGFRTLTILDGMRLSDPSGTQISTPLEHLMSSGIGRVEVLRGPQGLSYGSDAGGILNISSRQGGTGLRGGLDVQGGRYDTRQTTANLGGGNGQVDFFVSAADYSTEGFNTRTSDTVLHDNDGYDNTTFHGRVGVNLNENWRVELVHRHVDSDSQLDGCFLATTIHDCLGTYVLSGTRGALEYKGDGQSHALSYAVTDSERENFSAGVSTFAAKGKMERWEYVGSATELPGFDLVYGADFEKDDNNGTTRNNKGVYAEYLSDFSQWLHLNAGVRYDDNDDFGSNTSYRLGAAYLLDIGNLNTLKFKASTGTGLRAPSLYEISYNSGPFAYPPAALVKLKQEKSRGYDIGVELLTHRNLTLEATYFDQQIEDAIFFDLAGFSGYLQDNGTSKSKGVELAAEVGLGANFDLRANYTYNDTERPNGLQRRRVPKDLVNLGLSWHGLDDKLRLNAFYRLSRNAIDESGASVVPLEDFGVLDLSASYQINDQLEVYGRVENALNEQYQEIIGYNTAGAAAYLGIKLGFGGR